LALVGFGKIGQSSPQLFLSYTTSTFTTYGMNIESTCNWQSREWSVPLAGLAVRDWQRNLS
jgi:hypothetical protein